LIPTHEIKNSLIELIHFKTQEKLRQKVYKH
jgi:hypothetical protein